MTWRTTVLIALSTAGGGAAALSTAGASANFTAGASARPGSSAPVVELGLHFDSIARSAATAMTMHTRYSNPSDPNGKPSPLRKTVLQAPAGTVFDGHAVPACTASDNELMATGAAACPSGSQVGAGSVVVITGCGAPADPDTLNAQLFNGGDGIIELFSEQNSGARITVGHAKFTSPNTLTETPAPNPGCPPSGETSVRAVDFHFDRLLGAGGAAFITTPPACPPGPCGPPASRRRSPTATPTRRPARRRVLRVRHHVPSGTGRVPSTVTTIATDITTEPDPGAGSPEAQAPNPISALGFTWCPK